jgi:hypothetical protein
VPLDPPDLQDPEVFEEMKVQLDQQEITDLLEFQDKLDPVVPKDQREPQVHQVPPDQKVWLETQDHKENKGQLVCQDLQEPLVNPEHQELMEVQDFKDQLDHQDHQDHEELQDQPSRSTSTHQRHFHPRDPHMDHQNTTTTTTTTTTSTTTTNKRSHERIPTTSTCSISLTHSRSKCSDQPSPTEVPSSQLDHAKTFKCASPKLNQVNSGLTPTVATQRIR